MLAGHAGDLCRLAALGQAQKAGHVQASLGGSPTRLDWIKAYLRLKEKDRGPLDFDAPGGADTTWQLIYLCLRSGFEAEAVEVRRTYCGRSSHPRSCCSNGTAVSA